MYTELHPPTSTQTPCSLSPVGKRVLSQSAIMNTSVSPVAASPEYLNTGEVRVSLNKLRQLINAKTYILQTPEDQQVCVQISGRERLWSFAVLSEELIFYLQQLHTQTEQELSNIQTQLLQIEGHRQQLNTELVALQEKKKQTEEELKTNCSLQASAFQPCACRDLQTSIAERLLQSERLMFQEEALHRLHHLLSQDLHGYQEETRKLTCFTQRVVELSHRSDREETCGPSEHSMQGKNETEQGNNMEPEMDSNKQTDSPSEEEPSTPRVLSIRQNPKYQLFLSNDMKTNGESGRDTDGPGGDGSLGENDTKLSSWDTTRVVPNHYRGSVESLASQDLEAVSDRVGLADRPPRVFNSPYTTTSLDYNPIYRMSEFKTGLSPATSEMNLFSRSTSPLGLPTPTAGIPRTRFSAYDSLLRRRTEFSNPMVTTHYSMRSASPGGLNKKDYIEELTKQLDACQKRNHFLEAESVEMDKERNQIRFEMRSLLVNNEDLLRTNTQLNNELKKMREQMIEMERANQSTEEKFRQMETEVKEARNVMVEANNQEYAFNYLQQSLNNRIQDAEDSLDKQTLYSQTLSEKLWMAERQMEELQIDKDTREKKTSELQSTILRLEAELSEALQASSQTQAELSLQQKLRQDSELRMEEMEESLLEKEQELQRQQNLISRLQGEVSGKLIDKQQTLDEEIQLRERMQLQCKQAERMVEDLKMELQTSNQAKEDLAKQVKLAQEKMIDLESDLEELHDSEQRWAAKHKRAIEQTEQLQMKLIQEKDLSDQLETKKVALERQLRELRLEVEELHSSRVQEDIISRAEVRVKELENALRTEERNKTVLTNTITKLERRINEMNDQMEEENRLATEQKELMTQRIRCLKRQLNDAEEEVSRKEAQCRHIQRELTEERETSTRLQRQLLDQHLQTKRKETMSIRQTLDSLKLNLSADDDDEDEDQPAQQEETVTKV